MKRKTVLTVVALVALLVALIYLAVLAIAEFGILPQEKAEDSLFVKGYLVLPLPVIGLLEGILLQAYSVRAAKKKR